MSQTIKAKRSAVPGKEPLTTDLELGELGINTYDGKLFLKKDNGTQTIVNIGSGGGADEDAIHDNVAGEISAIAEKTTPHDNDVVLIEDSEASNAKKKVEISNLVKTGAVSTDITGWTLVSDDLYRGDFVHNLNTEDLAISITDNITDKIVQPEDIEFLNGSSFRVFVRGNTHNLHVVAVTGRGPQGLQGEQGPAGGGATDVDSLTDADTTTTAPTVGDSFVWDGTNWVPGKKTIRIGHTWAISGEIKVASGDTDFILPFFVSLPSGQTGKIVKARHLINSGTNCNVKIQKNGTDVTGFTNITVTTTAADTDPSDVTLADNDKLALVVNSVSGTPKNLTFTLFLEYEV